MIEQLERNKAAVRSFFAALEVNDSAAIDALVEEGYIDHLPGQGSGRANLKAYIATLHRGISGLRVPILHLVAEGDKVAALNKVQGTHRGELLGYPATGNRIDVTNFQLYRLVEGRLAEHWEVADYATLTTQLSPTDDAPVA
jgi:predicted ester cyclase